MPKSALTGTQKKAQKFGAKQIVAREKEAFPIYKDLLDGKRGPTTDLTSLIRGFERAGQGAEKIFAPIKEQAMADFNQFSEPQIATQFGAGTAGSSAMNQALAAARGNLARNLAADFASLQSGIAQNLLGMREQNKTNQYSMLSGLAGGMGQGLQSGAFANPYLPKSNQSSGIGGTLIGGGLSILGSMAGTEAGASAIGGALGSLGSMFSSEKVKENIEDYDKGLEEIRKMEVKKYDYTIPVEGKQKGRIGIIAEKAPTDIQDVIKGIKAVDVYGLTSMLVNAVKQLDMKVQELEAR